MAQPTSGPPRRASGELEGTRAAGPDEVVLSWSEVATLAPALVRLVTLSGQRLVFGVVDTASGTTRSLAAAVADPQAPFLLLASGRDRVVGALREALGIVAIEATLRRLTGDDPGTGTAGTVSTPPREQARERARQLLAQSATLTDDEQHPAFGVVMEELAPDEMRILRVFARDGDQPVVDVESRGPLGGRGKLVAERVSLLSEVAGCKHPDRLPVYLDNLERLRLVRIVDEPLDASDYEVIEAQDAAFTARDQGSRGAASARFLRRRLTLSAFGTAFCEGCLPG